jgi:hypothetical protein
MCRQHHTRVSPATYSTWHQPLVWGTLTRPEERYLTSALLMASVWYRSTATRSCPPAPPSARPTFARGDCATIVDYILLPTTASPATLAECEVVPHTSVDVHGVGSDHAPVLLPCLPQPPRATARGKQRATLRLERLSDPATRKSFQAAVKRDSVHLHSALTPPPATDPQQAQAQVDAAATAVLSLLVQAAEATLGFRTVVPGVTKSWMTTHVAEICARRRLAFARHELDPSPENLQRFHAANKLARLTCRAAQRKRKAQREISAQTHWCNAPGSRAAW